MTDDLRSALTRIVEQTADEQTVRLRHDTGLDAGTIVHRAGRARTRRAAVTATTALVAVAGVVLAGAALADHREPLPADSPTVAPSPSVTTSGPTPTPTETTAAVVLPTGDPSLPFGACGSLAASGPQPTTDTAVLEWEVERTALAAGDRLGVTASVRPVQWATWIVLATPTDGPQFAVLADGVVVGTATSHGTSAGTWDAMGEVGMPETHSDQIDLTVCAPDGQSAVTSGVPLPAATYDLVPWTEIRPLPWEEALDAANTTDSDAAHAALAAIAERVTDSEIVRGDPISITITGTAERVVARPGDDRPLAVPAVVDELVCGDPAPVPAADGDLTLEVIDPEAPRFDLRYTGPGRARGWVFDFVSLWAVQDGVVGTWYETEGGRDLDLAVGPGIRNTLVGDMTACPDQYGRTPLPAGEYQVYAAARVVMYDRVLPDGTVVNAGQPTFVVSEPWTVTVP
jgi:hypothetical protein